MAKGTQVRLVQKAKRSDSAGRDFEIGHAERILKVVRTSWELPKDSPYKLTENGLVKKPGKGNTTKAAKQGDA